MNERFNKMLNKEKDRAQVYTDKQANYRQQSNQLSKEIKVVTKEVHDWEKKSIQTNMELERFKQKNHDLARLIKYLSKDPELL